MKRYEVNEYNCKGIFSASRYLYFMLRDTYKMKDRKGGIIVFPEGWRNIDTSFVKGQCREKYLIYGTHVLKDGTKFSDTSICLDVRDYSSGDLMSLALKYSRITGQTIILKDFEDKRMYNIHFNGDERSNPKILPFRLKHEYYTNPLCAIIP